MAFWDFHDPRYKDARKLLILSLLGVISAGIGLSLLFWYGNTEPMPEESLPRLILSTPDPAAKSAASGATEDSGANLKSPASLSLFELAKTAIQEKNLSKAEKLLAQSVNEGKNVEPSLIVLGALLKERNAYRPAMDILSKAIELNPQAANLYSNRAECYEGLGDMGKAMADWDKAAEMSPSNPLFTNKRYLFMIRNGRLKDVESQISLKRDVEGANDKDSWVMASAAVALKRGKDDDAAIILEAASQLISAQDFKSLLKDPIFEAHRNDAQFQRFYR